MSNIALAGVRAFFNDWASFCLATATFPIGVRMVTAITDSSMNPKYSKSIPKAPAASSALFISAIAADRSSFESVLKSGRQDRSRLLGRLLP